MKCPCCGRKPISFSEFLRGANAVRTRCAACGRLLKANRVTWAWLIGFLLGVIALLALAYLNRVRLVPDAVLIAGFIALVSCPFLSWVTGGYVPVVPPRRRIADSPTNGNGLPHAPVEMSYSTECGRVAQHYRLENGELIYRCGDGQPELRLDLRQAEFIVRSRRHFHGCFYVGLVLLGFPLLTFAALYAKERKIDIGAIACVHVAFLVVGALLIVLLGKPLRGFEVTTGDGHQFWIFPDPAQPGAADRFVAELRRYQ